MISPHLHIVQPNPEPTSAWVDLPLAVKSKAAAIAALCPTFRALDHMATAPSVKRAKEAIKTARRLLAELEAML